MSADTRDGKARNPEKGNPPAICGASNRMLLGEKKRRRKESERWREGRG
jgi:hypothetical protein